MKRFGISKCLLVCLLLGGLLKKEKNIFYFLSLFSGLGFTMVIFIIVCMYLGIFLDSKLGTGANITLLMTLMGMGVGGWWTYRRIMVNTLDDEDSEEENNKKTEVK